MLELIGMRFTAAEVVVIGEGIPERLDTGIDIEKVTKHDDNTVSLVFNYYIGYAPDVASVKLRGIAFCGDDAKNIKRLLEHWGKKKEIPSDLAANAINTINANAAVSALLITRPFNLLPHYLPPPVFVPAAPPPMPQKKGKKTGKKRKK